MLKTQSILAEATAKLETSYFGHDKVRDLNNPRIHAAIGLMFDVIKTHYGQFKTAPDEYTIKTKTQELLSQFGGSAYLTAQELDAVAGFFFACTLDQIGAGSLPVAKLAIEQLYKICYIDKEHQDAIAVAQTTGDMADLQRRLAEIQAKAQAGSGIGRRNILSKRAPATDLPRVQTGVSFIDKLCGNGRDLGPTNRCSIAIISKQGGGKSTLGMQMCVEQCLKGKKVILILTEIGFDDNTYAAKLAACATGIDYKVIERCAGNIEEAARQFGIDPELARKKMDLVDQNLLGLDLFKHPGGLDKIENFISESVTAGDAPTLVYLDWAGPLAKFMKDNDKRYQRLEEALSDVGLACAQWAGRYNTLTVVAHQMATDAVQKGAFADNNEYCAKDCRQFTVSCSYVFVLNEIDQNTGLQLFKIAKSRNDALQPPVIVRLNGAIVRFDEATGFEKRGKRFCSTKVDHDRKTLPTEDKKRQQGEGQ
jgi:hypothetical protein